MKLKNIKFLTISLILLISNIFISLPKIGTAWSSYHVNSLIGLQKIIESNFLNEKHYYYIWNYIIYPVLETPIIRAITIIIISLYILKKVIKLFSS